MNALRSIATSAILLAWFALQVPLRGSIVIEGNQVHPAAGAGHLFTENFEGTGYQNTWTEIIGSGASSVNEDETTVFNEGSQSLKITRGTSSTYTYCAVFTASATITAYFDFRVDTVGSNNPILYFSDTAGGTDRAFLRVTTSGTLQLFGNTAGSVSCTTTATASVNTWYKGKLKLNRSTGAYSIEFNTNGTLINDSNDSGDYASNSNGETTQTIASIRCGAGVNNYTSYFDAITIDP